MRTESERIFEDRDKIYHELEFCGLRASRYELGLAWSLGGVGRRLSRARRGLKGELAPSAN